MNLPQIPYFLSHSASVTGERVDFVFGLLIVFATTIIVIVLAMVLFCVTKYHRHRHANREGAIDHSTKLEMFFATVLTVIALTLFAWAADVYADISRPPADTMNIYVVGKQWMWKLHQPNGREEINALHVPVGQAVKLIMTSQDVIHDFYVPAFRVKQDVLPDRYTTMWFTATKTGTYRIHCAQYCGTDHAAMIGWVYVMTQPDYQKWLDAAPANQPAIAGTPGTVGAPMATQLRSTFNAMGCIACHVPTSSVRAPRLDGIYGQAVKLQNGQTVAADEEYIRESILFPNAKISAGYPQPSLMPSYNGQLSEQQLRDLVDFVKSIRNGWPADATTQPASAEPAKDEPKP